MTDHLRRAVLLFLLVPLVAACGAEDKGGSAQQTQDENAFAAAFQKTTDAGSSRMSFDMAMAIGDTNASFTGEGLFDYKRQRGRVEFDMSGLSKVDRELKGVGKMEMIFDGLVLYMRMDSLSEQLPAGESWLKIDLRKAGAATGADLGSISQLSQSPAQQLQYLRAASKEIVEKGQEEIRGVETTQYRALVDVRKAIELGAESAPPEFRDQIRREAVKAAEQSGFDELLMDVWIDGEGLPRRISTMFGTKIQGDGGAINMSMDLFDFGVKVDVAPPAAKQAFDISEFMGQGQ